QNSLKINFLHELDLLHYSDDLRLRQIYIDIIAFLDGIYLYQKHPNHCSIYSEGHYFFNNRSVQQTANIIKPVKIDIEYRGSFSGVYSKNELQRYLQILQVTNNNFAFQQPISFILTSYTHAMILAYDELTQ